MVRTCFVTMRRRPDMVALNSGVYIEYERQQEGSNAMEMTSFSPQEIEIRFKSTIAKRARSMALQYTRGNALEVARWRCLDSAEHLFRHGRPPQHHAAERRTRVMTF